MKDKKYIIQWQHEDGDGGAYYGCERNGNLYMVGSVVDAFKFNTEQAAEGVILNKLNKVIPSINKGKYIIKEV